MTRARADDLVELSRGEVRNRALSGVFYVTLSGVANMMLGFVGNLVLARLLTPDDFGVVAVGLTVTTLAGALADGGLAAGMIRRPEPPRRGELRTMTGIQFVIVGAIVIPVVAVGLALGEAGAVTALMALSLPIAVPQTPGRVLLARSMSYDRQAVADFGSQACFYVFAVATVALGAGVWGLAGGTLVRAVFGTLLIFVLTRAFVLPSLRGWRRLGSLVRFGVKFQANWLLIMLREQSVNVVTAVIGGVTVLGLWTLALRLLQVPVLAFTSLYTVGFPALSHLLARGEDPGPVILRIVRRASLGATLVFPAFAASAPELIPALFGEQWRDAADVVPFIALSTLILGSISVGAASYLNASGRPGTLAWATGIFGVIWVVVTAALMPAFGLAAIGIGNLAGALVETWLLDRALRRTLGVAALPRLVGPVTIALAAGTIGWIACVAGPAGILTAIGAGALALALALGGLAVVYTDDLRDTLRVGAGVLRVALPKSRRRPTEDT